MNLILSFIHFHRQAKAVGPFESVRLDGETVRALPGGALVAHHREHQWEVDGKRYYRLDATTLVHIHFERRQHPAPAYSRRSRDFGPFERFSAVDGIAYTDDRVFAFVDGRVGDWFCYDDGQHWPVMVVSDAAAGSGKRSIVAALAALAPLLPGVIAVWDGTKLLYLGRADSIRDRLRTLEEENRFDPARVTAVSWETRPDCALHAARVRTWHLVEEAKAAVVRALAACAAARSIRAGLQPAAAA